MTREHRKQLDSAMAEELVYRRAVAGEEGRVFDFLLHGFWPEHRLGKWQLPPDAEKANAWIKQIFTEGVVFLAETATSLAGSIGVHPLAFWWTAETVLVDGWFFVVPEFRRKGAAKQLLAMAKEHAELERKPLIISIFNSAQLARTEAFYERCGFERVGSWYLTDGG